MTGDQELALFIRAIAAVLWGIAWIKVMQTPTTGVRALLGVIVLMSVALVIGGFAVIGAVPGDISSFVYTAVATASALIALAYIWDGRHDGK